MAEYKTLRLHTEGALARLTLARPERLNALNATTLRELTEAARALDADTGIRVVVLDGHGRGFCAGVDIKDLAVTLFGDGIPAEDRLREIHALGQQMVEAVAGMRAVTVASVRGCAIGGGLLLLAACDLRVIAEDTVLAIPEIDLGLPFTWGGVPRLVQELGPSLTREILMTGRRFTAAELATSSFAHRVVAADEVDAETEALAGQLLAKPALALALVKQQLVSTSAGLMADSSLDPDRFVQAMTHPGFLQGAVAYMQSRQLSDD